MARTKVLRTLSVLPLRHRRARVEHNAETLAETLRAIAVKNQLDQPRAFYSIREVSAHFNVPFSMVSRAYDRLEQEGLLTRMRGAKTLLQGLRFDRRKGVRAFIGLPASLSAFITIQSYRTFFIKIRRELRLRGFATGMVFYEREEARGEALCRRLRAYEVDTVLWFQPPKEARETAARLADSGIRLIGVAHEQYPIIPCRYEVRRDRAIEELVANWKGEGIDSITIVQWKQRNAPVVDESLATALDELSINWSSVVLRDQSSQSFVRSLQKLKTGGLIFSSAQLASKLCFRVPNQVIQLLASQRVAFANGPVSLPFANVPYVQVDLVVVDWQWVAEQITNDLVSQNAFQFSGPTTFEAEAKLRVPLSEFAQNI
jgi:hypothetical protein